MMVKLMPLKMLQVLCLKNLEVVTNPDFCFHPVVFIDLQCCLKPWEISQIRLSPDSLRGSLTWILLSSS